MVVANGIRFEFPTARVYFALVVPIALVVELFKLFLLVTTAPLRSWRTSCWTHADRVWAAPGKKHGVRCRSE
jgi:hypothetical protein